MKFSNKVYDILKFIAQIVLPAIATFYVTIASILKIISNEITNLKGTLTQFRGCLWQSL